MTDTQTPTPPTPPDPRIAQPATTQKAKKIPLVEMFGPTVQGEGAVIGQQTYFLRFGLCDYKCTMCDSMHAVDPHKVRENAVWGTALEIADAFYRFHKEGRTNWVTFSGGNPCIHDLGDLVTSLGSNQFKIAVETQGTFCPEWLLGCDIVTVSPKGPGMGEKIELDKLDEFVYKMHGHKLPKLVMKVVVFDQRDLEMARMLFERYKECIPADDFYLSLGNPILPGRDVPHAVHMLNLIDQYRILLEDIQNDWTLSQVKFLPQWHVFVWGNKQGV